MIELKRLRQYRNRLFYTRNRPLLITDANIKKNVYLNQYNKGNSLLYLIILTMLSGDLLRNRLKDKGITLSKLSEQLNISPQALNSRLNAKDLGINFINDIQNATGLILIDEPEINLHTDLGKKILDSIRNGLNNDETMFITTHSEPNQDESEKDKLIELLMRTVKTYQSREDELLLRVEQLKEEIDQLKTNYKTVG